MGVMYVWVYAYMYVVPRIFTFVFDPEKNDIYIIAKAVKARCSILKLCSHKPTQADF